MKDQKQKKLPLREEISDDYKWDLEAIYENESLWEDDFNKVKKLTEQLKDFEGKIKNSSSQLVKVLNLQDEISELLGKIFVYARMRKDEDNAKSKYQALADKATSLGIQVSSATAFIVPEILSIPTDSMNSYMQDEALHNYKQYLNELIRVKEHVLSEDLEQLLAKTGEISQASDNIFSMLNNADIKFPFIKDEEENEVELTKGRFTQFMESTNRRVRKDAFNAMYSSYENLKNTFAATLSSNVKKNIFYAQVRKYPSAIEASLFDDNVSVNVYNQLIDTIHDNLDMMHRYVKLRKKILNVDELHMYDIYVPIVKDIDINIKYEDAKKIVVEALKPLGEDYINDLKKGLESGWIDVYENKGKTSGAYSWGSYGTQPYILLNYQGKVSDLFTLAHELGHSMHSFYSNKNQPFINSQYKIFVAEVASTLNESLLMNYLLKNTTDKNEKLYYLNYYLDQFKGTVYRQTMFAEFEKMIYENTEAGGALTPEILNEMYHNLNKEYFGNDVVVDTNIDLEWSRIPHFYMNFYVYKYATGFSAAISLSKQILEEGDPAVNRYLDFLKSGGSEYPIEQLKKAGVDMTTKEPVQNALSVFGDVLTQMEKLLD